MQNPQEHINIFIAYSRDDRDHLERLRKYLKTLERKKNLKIWDDGEIIPGSEWKEEIKTHLNSAQVILLLVSVDSLASDYFYGREMVEALQRHQTGEVIVIPVILRPCMWHQEASLSKLQALPKNGKPLSTWDNIENGYTDIAKGIEDALKHLYSRKDIGSVLGLPTSNPQYDKPIQLKLSQVDATIKKKGSAMVLLSILSILLATALSFFAVQWYQLTSENNQTTKDKERIENEYKAHLNTFQPLLGNGKFKVKNGHEKKVEIKWCTTLYLDKNGKLKNFNSRDYGIPPQQLIELRKGQTAPLYFIDGDDNIWNGEVVYYSLSYWSYDSTPPTVYFVGGLWSDVKNGTLILTPDKNLN